MNKKGPITVGNLIKLLEKMPADLPVLTHGYKEHFDTILEPDVLSVKYNEENDDFCGMYELCDEDEEGSIEVAVLFRDGRLS